MVLDGPVPSDVEPVAAPPVALRAAQLGTLSGIIQGHVSGATPISLNACGACFERAAQYDVTWVRHSHLHFRYCRPCLLQRFAGNRIEKVTRLR